MMSSQEVLQHLRTAHLASLWLEQLQRLSVELPTGDVEFNQDIHQSLGVAQANLLRWRAIIGEKFGLIEPLSNLLDEDQLPSS